MSYLPEIDEIIQEGRGIVGEVLGQTYDVRRLTNTTSGSISSNTPVISGLLARIRKTTNKKAIENATFDLQVYKATCDNTRLVIQDVLTETGYKNDGGVYTYAQARPSRETLWIRTEFGCFISRPHPGAGNPEQEPTGGWVEDDADGAIPKSSEQILVLTNGLYSFEDNNGPSPASIYCGLQPLNRVRDGSSLGTPTDMYRDHFLVYVPDVPGEQLQELDRINFPNSDRYEVALVYTSERTGVTGYICIVEKTGT